MKGTGDLTRLTPPPPVLYAHAVLRNLLWMALAIAGAQALASPATAQTAAEKAAAQLPPAAAQTIDFAADVAPILKASCARCHARGRQRGGFSIESRERLLAGGDNGAAVVPGDSAASRARPRWSRASTPRP